MKAEEIDWSKAPEGTTHYNLYSKMWYKFPDHVNPGYYFYHGWIRANSLSHYTSQVERPKGIQKEPKMQFKNMKFRVRNEEHSKQIQEALFELGYYWRIYGSEVKHTAATHLYTSSTGELDWSVMESSFLNQAFPEFEPIATFRCPRKPGTDRIKLS